MKNQIAINTLGIRSRRRTTAGSVARISAGVVLSIAATGCVGAATFLVNTVNDFGVGSLRQAIVNANSLSGLDQIHFEIPGPGPYTIQLRSQLPVIVDPVNIDGTTQPGYGGKPIVELSGSSAGPNVSGLGLIATGCTVRGLIINRLQLGNGIELYGGGNHVLQGNYIGTDRSGTQPAGNDWAGILIFNGSSGNLIGGTGPEDGNVIANNRRSGIALIDSASRNTVQGNWIGTDFTGTNRMGNGIHGIEIENSSQNTIGGTNPNTRNSIAFNLGDGVFVVSGANNALLGNMFHANFGLGIDLESDGPNPNDPSDSDSGANQGQNYPLVTSVITNADGTITIQGALRSQRNAAFTMEFFASSACDASEFGEGQAWLGRTNVTTDAAGHHGFTIVLPLASEFITATATDAAGNTSEFCPCVQVSGVLPPTVELNTALDATNLTWTSGGDALWIGQSAVTHDGVDAARSGAIRDFQESWLETTVSGPGTLTFWWKVSSEMDFDLLEFSMDGTVRRRISGEDGWEQPFFVVAAGSHTLRWRYSKDDSVGLGQDRAWVDEVIFRPDVGPPVVLAQPVSQTVGPEDTVSFHAAVAGDSSRNYQWFHESEAMAGATNASLTLLNVGLAEAGNYHVVVTSGLGSVISSNATLTVTINRSIQTVLLLIDPTVSSPSPYRAALETLGRAYQAFDDNRAFNEAVANSDPATTLVVVDVANANAVLNPVGRFVNAGGRAILQYWALSANSAIATAFHALVVPPLLTTPRPVYDWGGSPFFRELISPLSFVDSLVHDGALLQPIAGGRAVAGFRSVPTTYQAALVIGHAGRSLLNGFMLSELSASDAARLAQNQLEPLLSDSDRPIIVAQPLSLAAHLGGTVTNAVYAIGVHGPLTYQWRRNGIDVPGATSSTLTLTNVQWANEGAYSVVVSDSSASITSSEGQLTVLVNLTMVQPVLSQSVVAGGDVTFSIGVDGHPPPFGYEWRRVSSSVLLASNVSNQRFDFLTLTNVQPNQAGSYRVLIRNLASPNGVPSPFTLTVLPDRDGDGLPDAWEETYPTAADAAQDTDRDGLVNLDEYRAGTDPTDATSVLRLNRIIAGAAVTLEFPAIATKTYSVQYQEDWTDPVWWNLADVLARPDNRTETVTDPASTSQRHYRLVTPRQP